MDEPQLKAVMPNCANAEAFAEPLSDVMFRYGIGSPFAVAAFLANIAVETGELNRLRENLNYSADALLRCWPTHFTVESAALYARNPQMIANFVYAGRLGNGDAASGDGWKYRGGGCPQLTGRDIYSRFSAYFFEDAAVLLDAPEKIEEPTVAAEAAGWYWQTHSMSRFEATMDFDGICDTWNMGRKTAPIGDSIGYTARLAYLRAGLKTFQ